MSTVWNLEESRNIIKRIKSNHKWLRDILKEKVKKEYALWDTSFQSERLRKLRQDAKLSPRSDKPGKIYIKLIEKQMTSFMAKVTQDTNSVDFIPQGGFVVREMADNIRKTAEFDREVMNMFQIDAITNWYVWMRWLGIKFFDGWDIENQVPIVRAIDPLKTIPDPANYYGSKMRFFWILNSRSIWEVKENPNFFNIESINRGSKDMTTEQVDDQINSNAWQQKILDDYDYFDCLEFFTYFENRLFLTTWANWIEELIRIIEIMPKTEAQRKDTRRIKIPINLKRRKFIPGRYTGQSIPDDVEMYQDQLTILANLQMKSARFQAYGPDLIVNTKYIDKDTVAKKDAWGRVIWYNTDIKEIVNPWSLVTPLTFPQMSQFPQEMYQKIEREAEAVTSLWGLTNWISPMWNQTKGEILELQKNINEVFWYSVTLMLEAEKEFWEFYYEFLDSHFAPYKKKKVIFQNNWINDEVEFTRDQIIAGKWVLIRVKSKGQEMLKKQRKFAQYQTVAQTILPNLNPWTFSFREFLRGLLDNWGFEYDEIMRYVPYTPDEAKAMSWLNLINNWQLPSKPKPWEDYLTYIEIYRMAKDCEEKRTALSWYNDAFKGTWGNLNSSLGWVTNPTVSAQIGNMAVSQMSWAIWSEAWNFAWNV